VCWPKQDTQNVRDIRIHNLSYAYAHTNYRRFSVPFVANPIIRNETASFHSLVQTHLFILRSRVWVRTGEWKETASKRGWWLKGATRVEVGPRRGCTGVVLSLSLFLFPLSLIVVKTRRKYLLATSVLFFLLKFSPILHLFSSLFFFLFVYLVAFLSVCVPHSHICTHVRWYDCYDRGRRVDATATILTMLTSMTTRPANV